MSVQSAAIKVLKEVGKPLITMLWIDNLIIEAELCAYSVDREHHWRGGHFGRPSFTHRWSRFVKFELLIMFR